MKFSQPYKNNLLEIIKNIDRKNSSCSTFDLPVYSAVYELELNQKHGLCLENKFKTNGLDKSRIPDEEQTIFLAPVFNQVDSVNNLGIGRNRSQTRYWLIG